jgi:L-seryl-tRNA(Ser) seleniumtransferase
MSDNPFRQLPAVARLLELPPLVAARQRHPADAITAAARAEVEALRAALAAGETPNLDPTAAAERIAARLDADSLPRIRPVINATGVVLHTNLGRSPLAEEAARAAFEAARGYLNL